VSSQPQSIAPHDDDTNSYVRKMLKNEDEFKKEQQRYLNDGYTKQRRERNLVNDLQREQKIQDSSQMKAQQSYDDSVGNEHIYYL
jgi:hypothetical protein